MTSQSCETNNIERHLIDAFSAFNAVAAQLEGSYRQLQAEVARLRGELEERNLALASSVAENDRICAALDRMLDILPCGVLLLDQNDQIVSINKEATRLLGVEPRAINKRSDLPIRLQKSLASIDAGSQTAPEQDLYLEWNGEKRWLSVRTSKMEPPLPQLNEEGRGFGSLKDILIVRDITAHKEAEEKREASRNMVALSEVTSILAHEVRNPLGSLELFAGLLADHASLSGEPREWAEHIRTGIRSLSATVNNVLSFQSPGSPFLVAVDVADLLRSSLEFLRPLCDTAGVALLWEERVGAAQVTADPNGIRHVLLNLVLNALRHTKAQGRITISAFLEQGQSGDQVVIEVSDTGSGITPEHLPHIFKPGFSLTGSTPGLGLSICRQILMQHRARISVDSSPGRGTTFRMEFAAL